jgi:hypothetical protein
MARGSWTSSGAERQGEMFGQRAVPVPVDRSGVGGNQRGGVVAQRDAELRGVDHLAG